MIAAAHQPICFDKLFGLLVMGPTMNTARESRKYPQPDRHYEEEKNREKKLFEIIDDYVEQA